VPDIDLNLLLTHLKELLALSRGHTDKLNSLEKGQRQLAMQIEAQTDESMVQSAILNRLEHELKRAVGRLDERLARVEERA
jgi:septal ring factor EnvC (AmiA/AmiB activator)